MSRYIDVSQLLEEIGTSARSASDPWTLSRSYQAVTQPSPFTPSVVADMGAPLSGLTTEIRSSQQITNADLITPSPSSGSGSTNSSSSSGFLGGLLNFFPLASGIAKLFGFGGSSPSPPLLTPYELPPSINFEGAMSGPASDVTSLSYGANGLPRASTDATAVDFASPAGISNTANNSNVLSGLMTLAGSSFTSGSSGTNSIFNTGLSSTANIPYSGAGSSSFLQNSAGMSQTLTGEPAAGTAPGADSVSTPSQQTGHNILVQVQAMDSQSFMDHSQEIAQAVRQAMLNMNSLNDVILDL